MFARTKGEYIIFVLYSFQRTTKVSCYKYLHCRGKTKVSYYILLREKQKRSYYITFFQTLLETFSCGLCYAHRRIILSYCEKRKVNYNACKKNKRASTLYFHRTTKVSCYKYLHCRGKTKVSYYITFFQTLLETFSCGLCYSHRRIILSYCEKKKVNYDVCKKTKRASTL